MKTLRIFSLLAMFAAVTSVAQEPVVDPAASTTGSRQNLWKGLFTPKETREDVRVANGLSTRSWTTIVGWRPGTSAFPDPSTHEAGLTLFKKNLGRK